ncbi:MAG: LPS assembly lipoprotein LptE [Chitinophagaceae bacterium]
MKIAYFIFFISGIFLYSCAPYRFNDASIPPNVQTIEFVKFDNRASYVNPQFAATITQNMVSKTQQQTRLTVINSNNADWVVTGVITEYNVTTSVTSNAPIGSTQPGAQQAAENILNVAIQVTLLDNTTQEMKDFSASASLPFPATQSLQQAEQGLLPEIVNILTQSIFNNLFSNW